jgi:steroid Delta-isomerase
VIGPRSSGQGLVRLVESLPAANSSAFLRGRVAAYYDSYASGDLAGRAALFAAPCHFEDPAGHVVATDQESLHAFFATGIPAHWSIAFRLDRLAVVADEALATTTLTLRAGERPPTTVLVNAHFVFDTAGLIRSLRTFFDVDAMSDQPI